MMKTRKTFVPTELRAVPQKLHGMVELSRSYFSVANELRAMARENGSQYVFPTMIMYSATVESYFNEHLAISALAAGKRQQQDLRQQIEDLKQSRGKFQKAPDRFKGIFRIYDRGGKGINANGPVYQNLLALTNLRNAIIHYSPDFMDHVEYPERLQEALRRSKVRVLNTHWPETFLQISVADWSYQTVKEAIQEFCRISGANDPFNCPEQHKHLQWE